MLAGMVRTAQDDDLWDAVLPVTRAMSEAGRRRFAELPAIHEREVLTAIVRAAMLGDSWREQLQPVPLLPREAQAQVWSEILAVADGMPIEQVRVLERLGVLGEALDGSGPVK